MKTKVFLFLCMILSLTSCGGDDVEDIDPKTEQASAISSIIGCWNIEKAKFGDQWTSASSVDLSGKIVITDYGYVKFRQSWFDYSNENDLLVCYERGNPIITLQFLSVNGNEAEVRYTGAKTNVARDLKVRRSTSNDVLCNIKDYLSGIWDIEGDKVSGTATFIFYDEHPTTFVSTPEGGLLYTKRDTVIIAENGETTGYGIFRDYSNGDIFLKLVNNEKNLSKGISLRAINPSLPTKRISIVNMSGFGKNGQSYNYVKRE